MDESVETALLTQIGRIGALNIALGKLIELTPSPDETRRAIRGAISDLLGVFEVSTDDRHLLMAGGMRSQMEDLLATD